MNPLIEMLLSGQSEAKVLHKVALPSDLEDDAIACVATFDHDTAFMDSYKLWNTIKGCDPRVANWAPGAVRVIPDPVRAGLIVTLLEFTAPPLKPGAHYTIVEDDDIIDKLVEARRAVYAQACPLPGLKHYYTVRVQYLPHTAEWSWEDGMTFLPKGKLLIRAKSEEDFESDDSPE